MKKYTWILGGLMAMAITACTSDELMQSPEQQPAEGDVVSVTAYAPGSNADSRVNYVDGTNGNLFNLVWSVNDKFSVIRGNLYKTFSNGANGGNLFTGTYPNDGSGTYYAVYPYIASGTASPTAVPFDLSTQTGELDSDMTYMYASLTNGQTFSFSHCTAILKVKFSFSELPNGAIKQIKVTIPEDYKVNGTIDLSNRGTLTGATENGKNDITITIPPVEEEPVSQAEGEEAYYIYLPPMTANDGGNTLNFEVTTSDNAVYTGTISRNGAIAAGMLYTATVALSAPPTESIPYVRFSSTAENRISLTYDRFPYNQNDLNYIEYSLDDGDTWAILDKTSGAISFGYDQFGRNSELLLRGICPNGTALSSNNTDYIQLLFSGEGKITCSGDICTLVDHENYQTVNLEGKLFCSLFQQHLSLSPQNTQLRSARNLILGDVVSANCYDHMFAYCDGLEEAPVLPATTLAESCYAWMFSGCESLNNVTMLAMDITATNALNGWLYNAGTQASNPTIYTDASVTLTEGTHYPDNWSVAVYTN